MLLNPLTILLLIINPPPTPVPIITPNTISWLRPAPSIDSDRAKQLASFSRNIFLFSLSSISFFKGLSFNQVELPPFIQFVYFDKAPGEPTPTLQLFLYLSSK